MKNLNTEIDMDTNQWREFFLIGVVISIIIGLCALMCGCASTSVVREYDAETGNLVKTMETSESLVDQVIDSTKEDRKSVV